ncbi:MAG: SDR family NAD(P)-dependent oxidoreductase, partial [Saprospiraceae bacterium]
MNCIITGATKGIGRAIAELFAKNGFHLAIAARNAEALNDLKADLEQRYAIEVLTFPTDLSRKTEVQRLADLIPLHWNTVDVLINNAGIFTQGALLDEPDDSLEKMLNVNLFSAYHLTRALLPLML